MDRFLEGAERFSRGDYFGAHEAWEELWRLAGEDRLLLQGLIQVAVGLHHSKRGNSESAVLLLERGAGYLGTFPPAYRGFDVARLARDARAAAAMLKKKKEAGEVLLRPAA